jgi:hypothetical protein
MEKRAWISVQDAAKIMNVTEVWVLRRLNDGTLPGFKINGRAWAVERLACEKDAAEYQREVSSRKRRVGRPRSA